MILENYIEYFEDEQYRKSFIEVIRSFKFGINDLNIIYLIKNIEFENGFNLINKNRIKFLLFYYFYLKGEVEFENGYKFTFKKNKLDLNINKLLNINNIGLTNFINYFDFGKNEIFLNKIVDLTVFNISSDADKKIVGVDNIVDYFLLFTKECSELYSFKGEHFPLLKWLINEII